jgi:hypothetical protein
MVTVGLAHPSQRIIERLFTLSLSSLAVGLPRLSRLVRGLADEVNKILTRDAAADAQVLFDRIGWISALVQATVKAEPQPPRSLIGAVRTQYEPVGELHLIGIGAYPWETASGFVGVTVLFWSEKDAAFRTWTASRPTTTPGRFDLDQTYRIEAPWSGGGAAERLSRSRVVLQNARANPVGRLSAASGIEVQKLEPAKPCEQAFAGRVFREWDVLHQYAVGHLPIGVREANPLDHVVILEPHVWGERYFDEIQQRFCWPILDAQNRAILLTLPWMGVHETSIAFLEAVKPDRDQVRRVVVRIVYQGPRFSWEPLSLLSAGTRQGDFVLNPGFDHARIVSRQSSLLEQLRKKYGRDRVPTTLTPDDEWSDAALDGVSLEAVPVATRRLFADLESFLLGLAETGVRQLNELHQKQVQELDAHLSRAGWQKLSEAIAALRSPDRLSAGLIWMGYLVRLHHFMLAVGTGS